MLEHEDMMDDDSLVGLMHDYDMGSPGGPGGMFLWENSADKYNLWWHNVSLYR